MALTTTTQANQIFDKNFEDNKVGFKERFGVEWNANQQLYLTYLQTLAIYSLTIQPTTSTRRNFAGLP